MQRNNRRLIFSNVLRAINNVFARSKSHYDILGITQKANQGEIKTAYYKLSMLHHPDKTNDIESKSKFRAITEAYEVLGNVKLKKLYDKGLLGGISKTTYKADEDSLDPSMKFYRSRSSRQVAPTIDGRTPIYDFDAWSKHHYSTVFEKKLSENRNIRRKKALAPERANAVLQEMQLYGLCFLLAAFIVFVMKGEEDLDKCTPEDDKSK